MTHAPYDPREALALSSRILLLQEGRLAMGGRLDSYRGYDLVVSCEEHLARKPMEGYSGIVVHCPMRDEDTFPLGDRERRIAKVVADAVADDLDVYVHCTGGLNRSGVIVALALQQLGYSPESAVRLMRLRRDNFVLCNHAFERFVLGQQLPTAETSVL